MASYEVMVEIRHLPGINDPEGATVERALPALGFSTISKVSMGKAIRFSIDADDVDSATLSVNDVCKRLLANPVLESFEIKIREIK